MLGELLLDRGRTDEAIAGFQHAAAQSPPGSPDVLGYAFLGLASAFAHSGRLEDARAAAMKSLDTFEAINHHAAGEARRLLQSIEGREVA